MESIGFCLVGVSLKRAFEWFSKAHCKSRKGQHSEVSSEVEVSDQADRWAKGLHVVSVSSFFDVFP